MDNSDKGISLQSLLNQKPLIRIINCPLTPKTSLFFQPKESPKYTQLNQLLQELYNKFETEIERPEIGRKTPNRNINMLQIDYSSLKRRRNKSENTEILYDL